MEHKKFDKLVSRFKTSWADVPEPTPSAEFRRGVMNEIRRDAEFESAPSVLDVMLDYAEHFGFGLAAASLLFVFATFGRGPITDQIPVDSVLLFVG